MSLDNSEILNYQLLCSEKYFTRLFRTYERRRNRVCTYFVFPKYVLMFLYRSIYTAQMLTQVLKSCRMAETDKPSMPQHSPLTARRVFSNLTDHNSFLLHLQTATNFPFLKFFWFWTWWPLVQEWLSNALFCIPDSLLFPRICWYQCSHHLGRYYLGISYIFTSKWKRSVCLVITFMQTMSCSEISRLFLSPLLRCESLSQLFPLSNVQLLPDLILVLKHLGKSHIYIGVFFMQRTRLISSLNFDHIRRRQKTSRQYVQKLENT